MEELAEELASLGVVAEQVEAAAAPDTPAERERRDRELIDRWKAMFGHIDLKAFVMEVFGVDG